MKQIVKLFFIFVLVASSFNFVPAFAEESGEEWDGIIKDPAGESITEPPMPTEPSTPTPAEASVEAPVKAPAKAEAPAKPKTVAPSQSTKNTPKESPATESPAVESPATEVPAEEAPTETTAEEQSTEEASPSEDELAIPVPETAKPHTDQKIKLLALISTSIILFSAIFIWSLTRLIKISKMEKLYKEAIENSTKAKNAKINRAG